METDNSNKHRRTYYGRLAGWVGIVCNLLLSTGKFIAGTLSGSVSITADALNNFSDASSSLISLIGFQLSEKRADAERRLAECRAALDKESESICRELEPQLSDLALDLVNQLQKWQDDRHTAVDADAIAAPYADMDHLPVGEHPKATTNRTM